MYCQIKESLASGGTMLGRSGLRSGDLTGQGSVWHAIPSWSASRRCLSVHGPPEANVAAIELRPVAVMSAHRDAQNASALGLGNILAKPFDADVLLDTVEHLLQCPPWRADPWPCQPVDGSSLIARSPPPHRPHVVRFVRQHATIDALQHWPGPPPPSDRGVARSGCSAGAQRATPAVLSPDAEERAQTVRLQISRRGAASTRQRCG